MPVAGVIAGQLQRRLRVSHAACCGEDALRVQHVPENCEALIHLPQYTVSGHADVVEEHLVRRDDVAAELGDRLVVERSRGDCLGNVDQQQGEAGRARLRLGYGDRAGDRDHPGRVLDRGDPRLAS